MRVLIFVPRSKAHPESIASILALQYRGEYSILFDHEGNEGDDHRFAKITRKAERIRQLAIAQGYDALVSIEDDQVVPPDTIERLVRCVRREGADVVYGLSVWRERPERWTAALELSEPNHHRLLSEDIARATATWGRVIDIAGVHMGCTLMTERALTSVTFERRGPHCYDYYAACDWQRLGIKQVVDTRLLVGHITEWGTAYPALNPPHMHRIEHATIATP